MASRATAILLATLTGLLLAAAVAAPIWLWPEPAGLVATDSTTRQVLALTAGGILLVAAVGCGAGAVIAAGRSR
jgi:hypothetical protein